MVRNMVTIWLRLLIKKMNNIYLSFIFSLRIKSVILVTINALQTVTKTLDKVSCNNQFDNLCHQDSSVSRRLDFTFTYSFCSSEL